MEEQQRSGGSGMYDDSSPESLQEVDEEEMDTNWNCAPTPVVKSEVLSDEDQSASQVDGQEGNSSAKDDDSDDSSDDNVSVKDEVVSDNEDKEATDNEEDKEATDNEDKEATDNEEEGTDNEGKGEPSDTEEAASKDGPSENNVPNDVLESNDGETIAKSNNTERLLDVKRRKRSKKDGDDTYPKLSIRKRRKHQVDDKDSAEGKLRRSSRRDKLLSKKRSPKPRKKKKHERAVRCKSCRKKFKQLFLLKSHRRSKRLYPCDCGINCHSVRCFARHKKIFHGSTCPTSCEICLQTFSYNSELKAHMKNAHNQDKKFTCFHCKAVYRSIANLKNHIKIHTEAQGDRVEVQDNFVCKVCGKIFTLYRSLYIHMKIHEEPKYLCEQCGQLFNNKIGFLGHMGRHTGELPFKCKHCSERFSTSGARRTHWRKIHLGIKEEQFMCDVCGKTVNSRSSLIAHSRIHTDERPFECIHCGKRFRARNTLKDHVRIHTGERPHACDVCDKRFSQKSTLNQHKKLHKVKEEEPESSSNNVFHPYVPNHNVQMPCSVPVKQEEPEQPATPVYHHHHPQPTHHHHPHHPPYMTNAEPLQPMYNMVKEEDMDSSSFFHPYLSGNNSQYVYNIKDTEPIYYQPQHHHNYFGGGAGADPQHLYRVKEEEQQQPPPPMFHPYVINNEAQPTFLPPPSFPHNYPAGIN